RLVHAHHAVAVIGHSGSGLPDDRSRSARTDDRHGPVGAKVAYGVAVTTTDVGAVGGQDVSVRWKTDRGVVVSGKIGKLEGATQTTVTACRRTSGDRRQSGTRRIVGSINGDRGVRGIRDDVRLGAHGVEHQYITYTIELLRKRQHRYRRAL